MPSTAFGYSVDDSSSITWGTTANDIDNTDSSIGPGTHTIHFKAWSDAGQCPLVDSGITVSQSGITVTSPSNNSSVNSPVWVRASVSSCFNAASTAFGYSVDDSTSTTWGVTANDIDRTDSTIPAGTHVIHFKAWSSNGQCPLVDRTVTVVAPAGITVTSPADNATVVSPVSIRASVSSCNGASSTAFGYSVDDSSSMTWGTATSINVSDSNITVGTHVIHFKAWSNNGQCPLVDRTITVNSSGGITVTAPADNASVSSPVWIKANVSSCNGSPSTAFGYSVDDSTSITWGTATDIDANDSSIQPNTHVIHFKAWSSNGQCPLVDRNITVGSGGGGGGGGLIPPGAISTTEIEERPNFNPNTSAQNHPDFNTWGWEQDPNGTSDSAVRGCSDNQWLGDAHQYCPVTSTSAPPNGGTRAFTFNYTAYPESPNKWSAERWHIDATRDVQYNHFVYDTSLYIPDPGLLWVIEMDMNVTIGGQTYLFGVQCDYGNGTWDVAYGSASGAGWVASGAGCDRNLLSAGWHQVQMKYSISNGRLVYESVTVTDPGQSPKTQVFSTTDGGIPLNRNWSDGILLNFQLGNNGDASSSGSTTLQLDHLTIWRWQ